jgi:hypothetical protein
MKKQCVYIVSPSSRAGVQVKVTECGNLLQLLLNFETFPEADCNSKQQTDTKKGARAHTHNTNRLRRRNFYAFLITARAS